VTIAPHRWHATLKKMREDGHRQIQIDVLWGNHEFSKGVRDFANRPRLRIERLLNLIQAEHLQANVMVGFPPLRKSLPEWAWKEERNTEIPKKVFDKNSNPFATAQVPDFERIQTRFFDFVKEVLSILSLYTQPDGPVRSCSLNYGYYALSISNREFDSVAGPLADRYQSIEKLNKRYQTNFSNFDSLNRTASYQLMQEKRPWLATYDFKWSRSYRLASCSKNELQAAVPESLDELFGIQYEFGAAERSEKSWSVMYEPVAVEVGEDRVMPFMGSHKISKSGASAYRLVEYLNYHSNRNNVNCRPLPVFSDVSQIPGNLVVVSGNYMCRRSWNFIQRVLGAGKRVFFVLGVPMYDENLQPYEWPKAGERCAVEGKHYSVLKWNLGEGQLMATIPAQKIDDGLWEKVRGFGEMMDQ